MILHIDGNLAVSLRCGLDAQGQQQLRGRDARMAGGAENRMQALVGQMVKHQVDDRPGVVRLVAGRAWLVAVRPGLLVVPLVVPSTRTPTPAAMAVAEVGLVPFSYVVEAASSTVTF